MSTFTDAPRPHDPGHLPHVRFPSAYWLYVDRCRGVPAHFTSAVVVCEGRSRSRAAVRAVGTPGVLDGRLLTGEEPLCSLRSALVSNGMDEHVAKRTAAVLVDSLVLNAAHNYGHG